MKHAPFWRGKMAMIELVDAFKGGELSARDKVVVFALEQLQADRVVLLRDLRDLLLGNWRAASQIMDELVSLIDGLVRTRVDDMEGLLFMPLAHIAAMRGAMSTRAAELARVRPHAGPRGPAQAPAVMSC